LFDKGGSLYGIDLAKSAIREADRVVVVEGYVDALMSHQGGTRFAVACLGTAITERQVGILKRLTKHLVLALDPDTAGDEATLRGLDVVKHVFDKTAEPVPNWRGLMQFERKLDADIRIVTLPRGKDPDELIRDDVTQWRSLLDQAPSIVDYYFATVLVKIDLTSPKEKELAIERLLPVIRDLGPGVQQEHYIQRLARELRVGERTLLGRLAQIRERAAGQTVAGKSNHSSGRPKRSLDEYLMALFLRHPQASTLLWQIAPDDLSHGPSRHVLTCMQSLGAEGADEWQHTLEPALADFISSLRSPCDGGPELEAADVEREVADCVAEIRRRNLRTAIEELGYLLAEAEQEGDAEARRQYMVRHEALFAELAKYEHSKSMARLWRW
jgi:DNA primase